MRQDKQFHSGEGVISLYFARLNSMHFDWLITVDPHLHRRHNLSEIYTIKNDILHSISLISEWIKFHVHNSVLIGPDIESEQLVALIAKMANTPYIILEKTRHGDRDVEV